VALNLESKILISGSWNQFLFILNFLICISLQKKQFSCTINQILNHEFKDYSVYEFSVDKMVPDIKEIPAKPDITIISVDYVTLNYNKIKETLKT
jgi:hypothetical protein